MEQTGEAPLEPKVDFVNFLSAPEVNAARLAGTVEDTSPDTATATATEPEPEEEFEIELVDSGTTEEPVAEDVADVPSNAAESNTIRQRRPADDHPNKVDEAEAKAVSTADTRADNSK